MCNSNYNNIIYNYKNKFKIIFNKYNKIIYN